MEKVFTISGTSKIFRVDGFAVLGPGEKKLCRVDICTKLGAEFLPLHASLLVKGNWGVAICGASGSGKTNLSRRLEDRGFKVMANDFIVVWREKDALMAGDLNLESENMGKGKCRLTAICLLSPDDRRDCFRFQIDQLKGFYRDVMHPLPAAKVDEFTSSWLFKRVYQLHFVLGNRQSVDRTLACFKRSVSLPVISRVGIIGMGTVGQDVANLLMTQKWLKQISLNSLSMDSLKGKVLDLRSANFRIKVRQCFEQKAVFSNSDLVVICFNASAPKNVGIYDKDERHLKLDGHLEMLWDLSRKIKRASFEGIALVVTNPVDLLSWAIYLFSNMSDDGTFDWNGLFSNQVFGVGLGLDFERLKTFSSADYELVGEHGDRLLLARRSRDLLELCRNEGVLGKVRKYSQAVRVSVPRTRFGPSHEVFRSVSGMRLGNKVLRLSTMSEKGYFWGNVIRIFCSCPEPRFKFSSELVAEIGKTEVGLRKVLDLALARRAEKWDLIDPV